MTIKGKLMGVNSFTSKKGTNCLFGNVATEFDADREPNGVGLKVIPIQAFGYDADEIYKTIMHDSLVAKDVTVNGMFVNGAFSAISIQREKW